MPVLGHAAVGRGRSCRASSGVNGDNPIDHPYGFSSRLGVDNLSKRLSAPRFLENPDGLSILTFGGIWARMKRRDVGYILRGGVAGDSLPQTCAA